MGIDSYTKKYVRQTTWGGKLTENVVQAVARDLLYCAMLRLKKARHKLVLAVHDELATERNLERRLKTQMLNIMAEIPAWANGLPIKVEGWSEPRYRK
jgi:DNA polymerase